MYGNYGFACRDSKFVHDITSLRVEKVNLCMEIPDLRVEKVNLRMVIDYLCVKITDLRV